MAKEILNFIAANPGLIAGVIISLITIVISILGAFGVIKKSTADTAKAMLAKGNTASEITDVTRLMIPEVEKIAANIAAAQKK